MAIKLITIDGIDGCGKTTLIENLEEKLTEKGYNVIITSLTCPDSFCKPIRDLVFKYSKEAVQYFFGALAMECKKVIEAEHPHNTVILCDRYLPSAIAYSKVNGGYNVVKTYIDVMPKPDLSIYLNIYPEDAMKRVAYLGTHMDDYDQDLVMLTKVKAEFDEMILARLNAYMPQEMLIKKAMWQIGLVFARSKET